MTSNRTSPDSRLGKLPQSSAQDAALRGASLAFGKPPVKPKPKVTNYSGNDGALAAAMKVGGAQRGSPRSTRIDDAALEQLGYQNTGSSVGSRSYTGGSERPIVQQRLSQFGGGLLQPPGVLDQAKSTSFIAATLAASRSASLSPNPTGQQTNSQLRPHIGGRSSSIRSSDSSRASSDQPLDTTSIPPTTSLIGMFEQNQGPYKKKTRPSIERSATSATARASPRRRSPSASPLRARTPPITPTKARKPEPKSPKPTLAQTQRLSAGAEPSITQLKPQKPQKPAPPSKPIQIPKSNRGRNATTEDEEASSGDSFVSASDYKPSFRAALAEQNRRLTSASVVSVNSQIDSMANAIVASSLASSRAASPSKQALHNPNSNTLFPPPPPPRRHLFHNSKDNSRTPSPAKPPGLRTTMRKPKEEEVDEGEKRRGKRNLVKKHPNKHHEGDRKRWRDTITERERKRYEAVWASNKGLFTPSTEGAENEVCNLVVRDIWSRSRLHIDVLEEVYTLVDRSGHGRLDKQEFVVGLWLIDQRLKGRKLPIRVTESVWRSVGVLGGIKVKKIHKH